VGVKIRKEAGCRCLTPVILATWEAEIRRTVVQDQLEQIVHETPISKIARASGGMAQVVEHLPASILYLCPLL
jgi:hypothetical protein